MQEILWVCRAEGHETLPAHIRGLSPKPARLDDAVLKWVFQASGQIQALKLSTEAGELQPALIQWHTSTRPAP